MKALKVLARVIEMLSGEDSVLGPTVKVGPPAEPVVPGAILEIAGIDGLLETPAGVVIEGLR